MFKNEEGFNILELVIAVAVAGVLAAIVVPQFIEAPKQASLVSLKSDVLATAGEAYSYFEANNVYPTTAELVAANGVTATGANIISVVTFPSSPDEMCIQGTMILNGETKYVSYSFPGRKINNVACSSSSATEYDANGNLVPADLSNRENPN